MFVYCLLKAGPIRLFTPYKRRRRTRDPISDPIDGEGPPRKHKGDNSRDDSNNDDSDSELMPDKWPTFVAADDIVVQSDSGPIITAVQSETENGHGESKFQKLDEVSNKLLKLAYEFKKVIDELKADERKQQRREQSIVAQLGSRTDVIETVGLQPASDSHKKKVYYNTFINLHFNSESSTKLCLFIQNASKFLKLTSTIEFTYLFTT